MQEVLEFINQVDLVSRARGVLEFLNSADPIFVAVAVALLVILGSRMAVGQPGVHAWGLRLAAAAFLAYGGYACYEAGGIETDRLPSIALRSAIVGGAVLAVAWIVLPVVAFLYGRIRLAAAAFLAYGGYALVTAEGWQPEQLPGVAVRAGLVAGLVLIVAWILQPVLDAFKALLPLPPTRDRPVGPPRSQRREKRADARDDRRDPEEGWQQRRDRARLKVELYYVLATPFLGAQFPRPTFEEFVHRYLGDHLPPEEVEENSKQLQLILQQQQTTQANGPQEFASLEELTRWFLDEQRRLQEGNLDQQARQRHLEGLQQRFRTLAGKLVAHQN
jgi:hypothetical protein